MNINLLKKTPGPFWTDKVIIIFKAQNNVEKFNHEVGSWNNPIDVAYNQLNCKRKFFKTVFRASIPRH